MPDVTPAPAPGAAGSSTLNDEEQKALFDGIFGSFSLNMALETMAEMEAEEKEGGY